MKQLYFNDSTNDENMLKVKRYQNNINEYKYGTQVYIVSVIIIASKQRLIVIQFKVVKRSIELVHLDE